MSSGIMEKMPGPTTVAIFSFGIHPSGMKKAVIRPQAMIAPMFGMIMLDRNVPNCWTRMRVLVRGAAAVVAVAMFVPARGYRRRCRQQWLIGCPGRCDARHTDL